MENEKTVKNNEQTTKNVVEKIKVKIPIDQLNPQDKEVVVGINEKYAKVIRGEETEVERPVYEQLRNAGLV